VKQAMFAHIYITLQSVPGTNQY